MGFSGVMESILELVWQADIVVKAVMLILVLASIWTWAVVVNRGLVLARAKRQDKTFENAFWTSDNLVALQQQLDEGKPAGPMSRVFLAAMYEWANAPRGDTMQNSEGLKASFISRVEKSMDRETQIQLDGLETHVGGLANVGSAAPFIGLFGTVWGIMNSFSSIADAGNTSLAVVAPGIAEALFATALGLAAAIPASIAYNHFTDQVNRASLRLDSFAGEFAVIIRRQIEQT